MAKRRRKNRTHQLRPGPTGKDATPKTFVIKTASAGGSVAALVSDMRRVLEPNTASRLRERKRNRFRDFVAMSGPLGVSHMLVFSQAPTDSHAALSNINMRLCRMPRGPTLTFKVLRFALSRDVLSASRHPHSPGKEYATEPLLILNNFGGPEKHLKLMTTIFQNLFPSIHVQSMPLTAARRVVLLSYNAQTRTIDLRHYLIAVRPIGISKPIRNIIEGSTRPRALTAPGVQKGVPDLSRASDVAEYVLHHAELGYASSASEGESDAEAPTKHVELAGSYMGRGNRKVNSEGEQRAIKLIELGPRLEMGLVKIEEGLGASESEVMFHELFSKTPAEMAALAKKRKEREQRRKTQEARVKAKAEAAAQQAKQKRPKENSGADANEDAEMEDAVEEVPIGDDDDDDFSEEDLFDEGASDVESGDVLDSEADGSSGSEPAEQLAPANPRTNKRDPRTPKFSMKGR